MHSLAFYDAAKAVTEQKNHHMNVSMGRAIGKSQTIILNDH